MQHESDYEARFGGMKRLIGSSSLERLRRAHVAVVGVGGVGSWTAEALARSGVGALTLIDLDEVCLSNVNRQLPALTATVGQPKVQVLRERIQGINPECEVNSVEEFFTSASVDRLLASPFDYVVDAIDSLANKCLLIARCRAAEMPIVTAGGAAGRRDPTAVKVADLAFASHDRLLRAVRKVLRTEHGFPLNDLIPFRVPCVFSSELPALAEEEELACAGIGGSNRANCNSGLGSATFVTGTFGFVAAAQVVRELAASRGSAREASADQVAEPDGSETEDKTQDRVARG